MKVAHHFKVEIELMVPIPIDEDFFKFNTYFTSVYPTAMWLQRNRPITGAEGSYKASDG